MASDDTTAIQGLIDRLSAGDDSAREALLSCTNERLQRLARKMLKSSPGVGRWEQTDDVLQNALVRLDRALRSVALPTTLDFFRLAAAQIRRELIDMARHYHGPEGLGAHHLTGAGRGDTNRSIDERDEPSDMTNDPYRLAAWTDFHRQIEALADDDRAIFDLLWYQGLTRPKAAAILGVSTKTVDRRWISARLNLNKALGGQLPA